MDAARYDGEMQEKRGALTRRNFVRISVGGAIGAMMLGLSGCGGAPAASQGSQKAASAYAEGLYTAECQGKNGPVVVEVQFGPDSIKSVEVVEHEETRFISDAALEQIPQKVVECQSLGIDTVTGATLTSMAVLNAVSDCVDQAGGDSAGLKRAPGVEKSEESVDLHADVIIAGAGASGLAAAIAAAQAGASNVIVFEKTSNIGGNALVSGGYLEYVYAPDELREAMTDGYREYFDTIVKAAREAGGDKKYLDDLQKDFDEYFASGKKTVYASTAFYNLELDYVTSGGTSFPTANGDFPINDYELPGVQLNDWLSDLGLEWKPCCGIVGFPWPQWSAPKDGDCGEGYFDLFAQYLDSASNSIEIHFCTPVTELILDGDRVVGVKAKCDDGTTYSATAQKGVILATGGYSGNPDMLKEYNEFWEWSPETPIPTTNTSGHVGDALTMAENAKLDVALDRMQMPQLFPFADCKSYSTETIVGDTGNCLIVNEEGRRFVNESLSRYDISAALMQQSNSRLFIISDKGNCLIEDGITQFGKSEEKLLANGQLFKADTIEELAEMIGVDPAALQETIDIYNGYAKNHLDEEFGRTAFTETSQIVQAPFYASPRTWAAHITNGGIVVNDAYQATLKSGDVVDGLYVVGEAACGIAGITVMGFGLDAAKKMLS